MLTHCCLLAHSVPISRRRLLRTGAWSYGKSNILQSVSSQAYSSDRRSQGSMSGATGEDAASGERTTVNKTAAKEMYCLSEKDVSNFPPDRLDHNSYKVQEHKKLSINVQITFLCWAACLMHAISSWIWTWLCMPNLIPARLSNQLPFILWGCFKSGHRASASWQIA